MGCWPSTFFAILEFLNRCQFILTCLNYTRCINTSAQYQVKTREQIRAKDDVTQHQVIIRKQLRAKAYVSTTTNVNKRTDPSHRLHQQNTKLKQENISESRVSSVQRQVLNKGFLQKPLFDSRQCPFSEIANDACQVVNTFLLSIIRAVNHSWVCTIQLAIRRNQIRPGKKPWLAFIGCDR